MKLKDSKKDEENDELKKVSLYGDKMGILGWG